jgi:hypothetical protein
MLCETARLGLGETTGIRAIIFPATEYCYLARMSRVKPNAPGPSVGMRASAMRSFSGIIFKPIIST